MSHLAGGPGGDFAEGGEDGVTEGGDGGKVEEVGDADHVAAGGVAGADAIQGILYDNAGFRCEAELLRDDEKNVRLRLSVGCDFSGSNEVKNIRDAG